MSDNPIEQFYSYCRFCKNELDIRNLNMADGCPCNSPRGINHGLVDKNVCTCIICDPEQTGSTRVKI